MVSGKKDNEIDHCAPFTVAQQRGQMVGDMSFAVTEDLPPQPSEIASVLVPDPGGRLIDDGITGLQHFIKKISVFADSRWHTRPKRFVHQADLRVTEDRSSKSGIGCCAE